MFKSIPKFWKRNQVEALMYGYVSAFLLNFPLVSVEKALVKFYEDFKIDEDEWPLETARKTYNRMKAEYFESIKTSVNES